MISKQAISLLLLLVLTADLVAASNRPGSGGGCDGAGPTLGLGSGGPPGGGGPPGTGGGPPGTGGGPPPGTGGGGPPGNGGDDPPETGGDDPPETGGDDPPETGGDDPPETGGDDPNARRFLREVAKPATKRYLQTLTIDGRPFTDADIDRCCSGNGDFEFLMHDLDVSGQAIATEEEGFLDIPGDSRWSCRQACRADAISFPNNTAVVPNRDTCLEACECRQNCPETIDYLTTECKATCDGFEEDTLESDLCIEKCFMECGERCRSTMNGYIVPLDIYAQGLEILDCYYGDLKGDAAASCAGGQQFWQSEGYTCTVTEGNSFDCECDVPGTCLNMVYPCDYEYYCVSQSPSLVPSDMPSTVPSTVPSTSPSAAPSSAPSSSPSATPSAFPTPQPTPRPTYGKGKGTSSSRDDYDDDYYDDDWYYWDDDYDRRGRRRRTRRGRTRGRRQAN